VRPAVDRTTMTEPRPEMSISHLVNAHLRSVLGQHLEGGGELKLHGRRCAKRGGKGAVIQSKIFTPIIMFESILSPFLRVRVRSDDAAVPRHRNGADSLSPTRLANHPPRIMPRPCSPHKLAASRGQTDSPEKRRLTTFGSAGSINHPDRKAFVESHSQRSSPSTTRHASLGDHKAFEAEALADVSVWTDLPQMK